MRWIADADKERIELARERSYMRDQSDIGDLLTEVLANVSRLEVAAPHPEPRIVPLTDAESRRSYPERYR